MKFNKNSILDVVGLASITIISFGYILNARRFAELHIQFPFLDFPIFVGEILAGFCLLLLILKKGVHFGKLNKWQKFAAGYAVFVLVKAAWGYCVWGPLALRHSALFYYPMFILFGYYFYNPKVINDFVRLIFLGAVFFILLSNKFYTYAVVMLTALSILSIKSIGNKWLSVSLILTLVLILPYDAFFNTARTMIVSNTVSVIFLLVMFNIILPLHWKYKVPLTILVLLAVLFGGIKYSNKAAVQSILSFKKIVKVYQRNNKRIEEQVDGFTFKKRKRIQLYNPDIQIVRVDDAEEQVVDIREKESLEIKEKKYKRRFKVDMNNIAFRLFLWRDMIEDLYVNKRILGFHFGKPLRSKSLEILKWGKTEWKRDGWVAAHNSYLHILYRSGIIGFVLVGILIYWLSILTVGFIKLKSINGLLLMGVLVNWFMAANFLVILELPYTAIFIWTLFGVMLAYNQKIQTS